MGLTVDHTRARKRLEAAVEWATSKRKVPEEWEQRAERISESPNKTFIVAFGTGLVARATDKRVDPLALKESSGRRAYSARGLGHGVLVPAAVEFGFHLGATGREPLNNQPFFRYDRIDKMDRVRRSARPAHRYLVASLRKVGRLSEDEALAALAAFLRVRLRVAAQLQHVDLLGASVGVHRLIEESEAFINTDPEGGKRGQAFVAAAFDLAFQTVRMGRINDPSRRFPGDVQVMDGATVISAAEVRQKPVTKEEAMQFAASLREAGVATGYIAALSPSQSPLPRDELLEGAEETHGVLIAPIESVAELLVGALTWSGHAVSDLLEEFPQGMVDRLEEIEASGSAVATWAALFAAHE